MQIVHIVGYNLVWTLTVYGWLWEKTWLGFVASIVYFCLVVKGEGSFSRDLQVMIKIGCLGFLVESFNQFFSIMVYEPSALFAPLWILPLWASFGIFHKYALRFMHHRIELALVLGGPVGAFTYWMASRIMDVSFGTHQWVIIGLEWAVLMVGLGCVFSKKSNDLR
ncbi:DUF2878 domain-containing protein [bacterium]|jgi:hypothetical protein|nr:DUF2878 domain-containing protein [bacterium]